MKTPETEATKDGATSGLAVAPCSASVEQRNRIGSIFVEDFDAARGDNLAIVLASYFSRHMDRPEDDANDSETGWGEWVIAKTNRALELIAEALSPNNRDEARR